jgi:ankyrin repeat protein
MLVDLGAQQIKSTGNSGHTPLTRACSRNHESIVEALLANGNPNPESVNDSFSYAVAFSSERIAKLLLKTGLVEINKKDEYWRTPLSLAATRDSRDICALLLDLGADATRTKDGKTPLLQASSYGHADVVELLLQHAAVGR